MSTLSERTRDAQGVPVRTFPTDDEILEICGGHIRDVQGKRPYINRCSSARNVGNEMRKRAMTSELNADGFWTITQVQIMRSLRDDVDWDDPVDVESKKRTIHRAVVLLADAAIIECRLALHDGTTLPHRSEKYDLHPGMCRGIEYRFLAVPPLPSEPVWRVSSVGRAHD